MSDEAIPAPTRPVFILVDGENVDGALKEILRHKPTSPERPRWDRVISYVRERWGSDLRALFFIRAHNLTFPNAFVQMLASNRFRPILLRGSLDVKVVDIAIQRTLDSITGLEGDVVLLSHDVDFLPNLHPLISQTRRVAIVAFPELLSAGYIELMQQGLEVIDLESDVKAFDAPLNRTRVIDIDDFDPTQFLGPMI